jgi:UPF0716 protein FxsA
VPVLLLLLVGMFVEITVLVLVGQAIGLLLTILLLILASVAGMWLLRREGARTFRSFQEALRERRVPHRELVDGALLTAAGVLIILPGFVSDLLALALLFPPTRALVSRRLVGVAERRARPAPDPFVVDSTVVGTDEIDRR